jgi:hypothetical protein
MVQVARIGGQLLQDNLLRELADLKFDNDLLVIKRDGTLGINTTTTPRAFTINGTLKTNSGSLQPDVIFGNSLKVGDFTLATTGISTLNGDVTLKSTHPEGYIVTNGLGSYNFAVRDDGLVALGTNDSVGLRSEVVDGSTAIWNANGNWGTYWYPGPIDSASSPPNDGTRLYDEANAIRLRGAPFTQEELDVFDWDEDGDIQADDVLKTGTLNTQFSNGQAFPASRTLGDHPKPDKLKEYIETNYPRSAPRRLIFQTGNTMNVDGNVHATGNITYGGSSITIGDDSTDTANFFADFVGDLLPNDSNRYHIGKADDSTGGPKGWRITVDNLIADSVTASGIVYQGIELTKDVGILFVSNNNGNDNNEGNNPGGPFATITKALSVAQDGDLIYIYPGEYQEDFPMTVPKGVTIKGESIRSVEIQPTSATQSNDAFLLNSDVTIENVTLKDYYYDSINDTGYGFRFANDFTTTIFEQEIGRSPYVRNVTVITKGSTTNQSDPRGFDAGDAGKGALVDGSVVNQNSRSASMLFHSVTFITPGVDALTIRNGVRVEWLNSFTYFANRGTYIQQGSEGRLLPDSSLAYGGELRTIASANVYGNKGIEADGVDCLAYLINQNFAYIGSGKDVTNDNTKTVQANEVTELNNAQVYFTGQDQRGNFRVGDKFLVDLENERTSFDVESIFADNTKVTISQGNSFVVLEPGQISLDNIVITGNNIESTRSAINFNSVGSINFQGNVELPNVDITGNFTVDGAINNIGDAPTDTVDFNTPISQDFVPGSTEGLELGTPQKRWKELFTDTLTVNSLSITDSTISSNETNANIILRSKDSGRIILEDIELKNNTIFGKFIPEGEFDVFSSLDPVYPSVFNGYVNLRSVLPKYTSIFNIPILGTDTVSADAVKHAANILGSLFDNNFDGEIDNTSLYADFSDGLTAIVVYADSTEESNLSARLGSFKPNRTFSVYENEMNNFQGDGYNNQRDLTAERILKDLLVPKITLLHSDLSTTRPSTITDAMDSARGGYQAGGVPGYNYPPFAWYTDPTGLSYQDLVYEYLYLLIATEQGALEWRSATITSLWDLYNSVLLQTNDLAGYNIVNTQNFNLPIDNIPSIDYWTQVTNTLGGTKNDVVLSANQVTITGTKNIKIPVGTSLQRPARRSGVRFNSDYGAYEGTETSGSVSLDGIYDTDRDTYLDLSNNQFNFVTNGVTNHTLNKTLIESKGFSSNHQFSIDDNIVSADDSDGNSILRANGTGYTKIGDVWFQDSDLVNNNDSNWIFDLTNNNGEAFLKFDNVNGIVVPQGTSAQRPSSPEVGHTRYNLDLEYVETWNGSNWINAAGEVESIESDDVEELAYIFNLILD